MILLGVHFKWNDFLYVSTGTDNILRLQFTAREEDKKYIEAKIKGIKCSFLNEKMEHGLNYISKHLKKILQNNSDKDFENYIFEKLTFFLSELPGNYSPMELNTYFERMNTWVNHWRIMKYSKSISSGVCALIRKNILFFGMLVA